MQKQLEEYLNQFALRLSKLPSAQREGELREIRQHLEALAASHRHEGKSEEEAIHLAISQFGRAEKIGRDLNRANSRNDLASTAAAICIQVSFCMLLAYGFFALVNDKPTDFPYHQSDKLILAACLALAGVSIKRMLERKKVKA